MDEADKKFLDDHIIVAAVAGPSPTLVARRRVLSEIVGIVNEIQKQASIVKSHDALLDDENWKMFLRYTQTDAAELTLRVTDAQEVLNAL